ncbi:DUF4230 domain-containing protein [Pseudoflavonifractor sp. MSJ-37]|uniref:DUF4230 domain-containing protein n=1 Tax=Pseudoflavonifractor sp. MSJ-37 TaxID=2841531 RepID=UPI001C101CFC|nr:DUF4230 domain-containing protein [Pseudoflavonifractor sp. MSJ-37]MBU5434925.1 DUF4230 domain-containing protein [Pseudoflavonifractor sp. MSJ-37]
MPMREQREAKRGLGLRGRLILVLIAAAALTAAFLLGGILSRRETEPVITSELLGQQLTDIQELSTVEYHYTNMGRFEDQVDFYGWKVPFTTKSFIVAYDGTIKAGTDLSGMDIQVSGDRISVTLPAPEILSHEIDEDSIQVYDQTHNIFNQIEISDYTGFTADQKSGVEEKAIDNGLLTAAKERSEAAVKHLLSRVPGVEGYAVSVTTERAAA